jgi:hypothetical protein
MINKNWKQLKKFYKTQFNLNGEILEILADYDVLLLCVSGLSNLTISKFLDITTSEVRKIIMKNLHFLGWEEDLKWNPYYFYRIFLCCDTIDKDNFSLFIKNNSSNIKHSKKAFDLCISFDIEFYGPLLEYSRKA